MKSSHGVLTCGELGDVRTGAPQIGSVLGEYRLEGHLGRGGMGEVFLARSLSDEVVALKYIHFATPTLLYRFKREFRALAGVRHPNLVSLGQLEVLDDGRAYYTMEIVEGVPFVEYVRKAKTADKRLARLLRATIQLVEAVCQVHQAGCIHRDIKPSNVLVTASGRVVLLDFGVVFEYRKPENALSRTNTLVGTAAYMAPEQAKLNRCRPASDLYSIGVMLYEAIYGRLPLLGSTSELISVKRSGSYELVIPEAAGTPEPLLDLIRVLLAPEPWERPSGRRVIQTLRSVQSGATPLRELDLPAPSPAADARASAFVGRTRELEALMSAYETSTSRPRCVCVCVSGASGQGKSTLLHEFVDQLGRATRQPVVLRGRCLERESVPYRGVDEVVDSLSVFLRRVPTGQRLSLQPRHAGALARLFPVLGQLWPSEGEARREPGEQRNDGVFALREVLTRIGDRHPLVLVIDDFHRADIDGRRILGELLRPPNAPNMLLIVSSRDSPSPLPEFFCPQLEAHQARDIDVREIALGQLEPGDVESLVRSALTPPRFDPPTVDQLVDEAMSRRDQSPFALQQWILDVLHFGASKDSRGDVVRGRIARLPALLRDIVSAVALAGGPVRIEVVAEALGVADIVAHIDRLCSDCLLVRCNTSEVDTAHDKIRRAGDERLGVEARQQLHAQMAAAMAEYGVAPELLVEHLALAGRVDDAYAQALAAAEKAASSLAFARATRFYRRALELLPADVERRRELELALAEQLANDGRGLDSSEIYVELAAQTRDASEARALRRRAALLLFLSGRIHQGMAISRGVLRELGERLPRGRVALIASLVWERLRLELAWTRWRRRRSAAPPADAREREVVETLLIAVRGLGAHEHVLTYGLQSRALRLALARQPSPDLVLLLGTEFLAYLARGEVDRGAALRQVGEQLMARFARAELDAVYEGLTVIADSIAYKFDHVVEDGPRVWARLANDPAAQWLRAALCSPLAWTWLFTGDLNTVRRECRKWLLAATERGNFLQAAKLTSQLAIALLYSGELDAAHELIGEGAGYVDESFFSISAVATQIAHATALSYEGEHEAALRVCRRTQRRARRAGLMQLTLVRCIIDDVCGRCELALVLSSSPARAKRLRRRISRRIKRLKQSRSAMGIGFAAVLKAGLASSEDRESDPYSAWREADMAFTACAFAGHQAAVRYRLGEIGQDPGSAELRRRADAFFDAQGVSDPESFTSLLAPCRPPAFPEGVMTRRGGRR